MCFIDNLLSRELGIRSGPLPALCTPGFCGVAVNPHGLVNARTFRPACVPVLSWRGVVVSRIYRQLALCDSGLLGCGKNSEDQTGLFTCSLVGKNDTKRTPDKFYCL